MVEEQELVASILSDQAELLEAHARDLQEHAATLRRMVRELGEPDVHQEPHGPESSAGRPN